MDPRDELIEYIPEDVRRDIRIAGATIKQFISIILPMFILGITLFITLPGLILIRFILLIVCTAMGFYIVLGDVLYKRRVKKQYKKAKENLDTENIQYVSEYNGAFMVFEDSTVGACLQIDVSPWEASPTSAKSFDTVIFRLILRLCALNNLELISLSENKSDNSDLNTKYQELFHENDPLYQLGEQRRKTHERVKSQYGRKTYYIWRIRQLESKRNIKESIKEVGDSAHEILGELAKIGATGILLGEDEIRERTELMLLPEGTIYKPLLMENSLVQKAIGEIIAFLKLIKLAIIRPKGSKFNNKTRVENIDLKILHFNKVDPKKIQKLNEEE